MIRSPLTLIRRVLLLLPAAVIGFFSAASSYADPDIPARNLEAFLLNLYNHTPGSPGEAEPADGQTLWGALALADLAGDIESYFGREMGGVVAPGLVLGAATPFEIEMDPEGSLLFLVDGVLDPIPIARQSGKLNCHISLIMPGDLAAVSLLRGNIECLFAGHVREQFLQSGGALNWDFVKNSGVSSAISSYLNDLRVQGVLSSFQVDLEQSSVVFEMAPGHPGVTRAEVLLGVELVNPFLTSTQEIEWWRARFESAFASSFLYVEGGTIQARYDAASLAEGLRTAKANAGGDGWAFQASLLQYIGLGQSLPLIAPAAASAPASAPVVQPCSVPYEAGTVTPCNNKAVVFYGWEYNGYLLGGIYNATQAALKQYGYTVTELDSRLPNLWTLADTERYALMKEAQVIIFGTHGSEGRMTLQVYPYVPANDLGGGTSKRCCDFLKATAVGLGLPGAASINCDATPRPSEDPSGSIKIIPFDPRISGTSPEACRIVATNLLYPNLGKKAVVITVPCFAGTLPGDLGPNFTNVVDLVVHSKQINYNNVVACDDGRLAKDIRGAAQYCSDTVATKEPFRPISGGLCGSKDRIIPAPQWALKTVQGSVQGRGTINTDTDQLTCLESYNASGFLKYNIANAGGDAQSAVELAPQVAEASFDVARREFSAVFTSKVDPSSAFFSAFPVNCERRKLPIANFVPGREPKVTETGASFQLNENFRLMDPRLWSEAYTFQLNDAYGKSQREWPWYIYVSLQVRAKNGISLVGNMGALEKWIWGYPVWFQNDPPWRFSNGDLNTGGRIFQLKIPCDPPMVCCMPNIEVGYCVEGTNTKSYCKKNGCTLTSTYKNGCFYDAAGRADLNCGKFTGSHYMPFYEPCNGQETGCEYSINLPAGVPPEKLNCWDTPDWKIADQFKKWPVNGSHQAQQCPSRRQCQPIATPSPLPKCSDVLPGGE